MSLDDGTKWISIGEAARLIGVSTEWVRQLAKGERFRHMKTPYGMLVDEASLNTYVAMRNSEAKDPIGRLYGARLTVDRRRKK